jgi:hypothetical protein
MSVESLEFWKNAFEIAGVVLLLLTFIAGAGVLGFSRKLNLVQADKVRQFDKGLTDAKIDLGKQQERAGELESENLSLKTDLEKAKIEAAKAQLELRRYIDHVDRKTGPRRLDRERFLEQLKNKPTGSAFVTYKPEDIEAYQFATAISSMLQTAGWNAPPPCHLAEEIRAILRFHLRSCMEEHSGLA